MNGRASTASLSAIAAVALAPLAWQVVFVLLVAFAGVLLAVLPRHCALVLARHAPLPVGLAIAVVILGLFGALGLFPVTEGPRIGARLANARPRCRPCSRCS